MAAAHPLSPLAAESVNPAWNPPADAAALEQSLIPMARALTGDGITLTAAVARLPVELDVSVPVRNFRVRNLLALEQSQLIESGWGHGEDLPLAAGEVQLAWSEFEVIDTQLSVRVTRLV
jgi:flagellar motor switch protein FliN/FliY